jgi:hypothetical protein
MWPFTRKQKRFNDAIMQIGGPNDWLTISQCESNVALIGQVGSGKTTGPGANFALGLLAHRSRPGALILCQKPDEAARWKRYCKLCQIDRSADVIHVQLGGPHVMNMLNYTLTGPGGVEEAKAGISVLMEVANRNRSRNSSDSYWDESSTRAMGNSMTLKLMADGTCSYEDLREFMNSLPVSVEQVMSEEWNRNSFAGKCLHAAHGQSPNSRAFEMAAEWLTTEWPELSDKTRSVIHSVTINTLDKFLSGQFADLISNSRTTFTPEMALEDGRIIIFDVPGTVYGPAAVWASVAMKLLFQKALMRRGLSGPCRPVVIWADEAANFLVPEQDAMFLSQSRQFKAICVNIIQNIPLAVTALGSNEAARHQTHAWLSNHATVICAANSDPETNQLFSAMAGETRETFYGGSTGGQFHYDIMADLMGQQLGNASVNWSQLIRPALPAHLFGQLAKGGAEYRYVTEAYVMQSGRRFSNGKTFIKAAWRQRW